MQVLAIKNKQGVYLTRTEQQDDFLSKGYVLFKIQNGNKVLIATPEKGFISEKPKIEINTAISRKEN